MATISSSVFKLRALKGTEIWTCGSMTPYLRCEAHHVCKTLSKNCTDFQGVINWPRQILTSPASVRKVLKPRLCLTSIAVATNVSGACAYLRLPRSQTLTSGQAGQAFHAISIWLSTMLQVAHISYHISNILTYGKNFLRVISGHSILHLQLRSW